MEEISWTDRVRNEEMLQTDKKERNRVQTTIDKANTLRRNCLLKYVTEGKIEVTGRRGRKRKQLLDDVKETRGYCKLKDEALDRTVWRIGF